MELIYMWIVNLKSGKHKFVDTYKNPLTNRYQEVSCTFGKNNRETRKKAQLILDEKIRKKLAELTSGDTEITFYDLSCKYLALTEKQLTYSSWYSYCSRMRTVNKDWGHKLIASKITPQFINKYLDSLLYERNLTNSTVTKYKSTISSVYSYGKKYGYVTKNPVDDVQVTLRSENQRRRDEIENKYLDKSELDQIMLDCRQQHRQDIADILMWMYLTGMRCGEAAAMQKKNIVQDKDGNYYAKVEGTLMYKFDGSKQYTKTPNAKTFAGNRDVLLPPLAVSIAKRNAKGKDNDDFLFRNENPHSCRVFNHNQLDSFLRRVRQRQHIKKRIPTHIFRHTHVSVLAAMGVPLYVIQHRVGHSNSQITRKIYLHVTKVAQENLIQKLDELPAFFLPNDKNDGNDRLRIVGK